MDKSVRIQPRQRTLVPRRTAYILLLTGVFAVFGHPLGQAEEILDYLPEDALGFIVVRDLGESSERIQKLAMSARVPLPGPLGYFKYTSGIAAGLDEKGDLLVALIPGSRANDPPEPMVLLPIDNYDEFSASVKADPSGKVSSARIADEKVLVAKQGSFAMVMNEEHRESLELITSLEPSPIEILSPWTDWLLEQHLALIVMPEGKDWLRESSQDFFLRPRTSLPKGILRNPEIAGLLGQIKQGSRAYQAIFEGLSSEIELAGYGLAIDKHANVRFGKRAILKSDFHLETQTKAEEQLLGFADQPFMFAGGSAIPKGALEKLIRGYFRVQQQAPDLWDLEDLPADQWQAHEDATVDVAGRIESVRFLVLPGKEDEPLLSNFLGILQVSDSADFLESYEKQVEVRNQILAQSNSDISLQYEVSKTTVEERSALAETLDVATAVADPDVPILNWMIEAMLGEDGKLDIYWVAADQNHVVFGISDREDIVNLLKLTKSSETGLHASQQLATTRDLMPGKSVGQGFVSPHGCALWVNRVFDELIEPVFGHPGPEFTLSDSPPIGFSLEFPKHQINAEIVWPVELTKSLVKKSD